MVEQTQAENQVLLDLNGEHEAKIEELKVEAEAAVQKMEEMRHAFKTLQEGREKELREVSLIYFAKKKELFGKYVKLGEKFKAYRDDTAKELRLKEVIEKRLREQMAEQVKETQIAKLILKDPNLSKVANERFQEVIEQEKEHVFLKGGTFMDDLIEQ